MPPGALRTGDVFGVVTVKEYVRKDRNGLDFYEVTCRNCGTTFITSRAMLTGMQFNEKCVNGSCKVAYEETRRSGFTPRFATVRSNDRAETERYIAENATNLFENRTPAVLQRPTREEWDKAKTDEQRLQLWAREHAYRDANGIKTLHE